VVWVSNSDVTRVEIWRHWLVFSIYKQFYAMFYKPSQRSPSTVHPIYLRYTDLSTQMLPVVLNPAQNSFTVSTNTTCTKLRNVLILHHQIGVRGALLPDSPSAPTPYEGQNYTTMKSYLWTTLNSNRLLQGRLQVNSVTRPHHAIYAYWLQPFAVCVTEISIYFHSGWHYRCSVTLVPLQ